MSVTPPPEAREAPSTTSSKLKTAQKKKREEDNENNSNTQVESPTKASRTEKSNVPQWPVFADEQPHQPASTLSFTEQYCKLLERVLAARSVEDDRTQYGIRAIHGVTMEWSGNTIPMLTIRRGSVKWISAESVWFFMDSCSKDWMESWNFGNWSKFADEEGNIRSAYGWRWRCHFEGVDQLSSVVDMLSKDPSAKRTMLSNWDPSVDLVPPQHPKRQKNAPCVVMIHFTIVDNKLCATTFQRSCDIFYGLPSDAPGLAIVHHILAAKLGLEVGRHLWVISNLHCYSNQVEHLEKMMEVYKEHQKDPRVTKECVTLSLGDQSHNQVDDDSSSSATTTKSWYDRARSGDRTLVDEMFNTLLPQYKDKWLYEVPSKDLPLMAE